MKKTLLKTAKVKWYNEGKGYGFVDLGDGRDAFVHFTAIRSSGYKTLRENQTIFEVEVIEGPKGVQVKSCLPDEIL